MLPRNTCALETSEAQQNSHSQVSGRKAHLFPQNECWGDDYHKYVGTNQNSVQPFLPSELFNYGLHHSQIY